jgi:L-ascorbate metabolism protein UlaG (beta-lactamase superfamily)
MTVTISPPQLTYLGGPTLLIEWNGLRLLTDPTFDPAATNYETPAYTLHKTQGPPLPRGALGRVDVVLLSHDHHFDNLDHEGRALLADEGLVLTTRAGAERLGDRVHGLAAGEKYSLDGASGARLGITATPARHGPEGGDRGPVIGFLLEWEHAVPRAAVWVTGDTVWYSALDAVGADTTVRAVIGFFGAARVAAAGPSPLTLTAEDGLQIARQFPDATIVPVHYEGWAHFTEGRGEIATAFAEAGLAGRLQWLERGRTVAMKYS